MMGELARCPAARMLIEQDAAVSQAGKRKGAVCRLSLDLARDIRGVFSISGRTPATITAGPWHEHGQLSAVCSRPMRFPICAASAAAFTERYRGKGRTHGADVLAMGRGREARTRMRSKAEGNSGMARQGLGNLQPLVVRPCTGELR